MNRHGASNSEPNQPISETIEAGTDHEETSDDLVTPPSEVELQIIDATNPGTRWIDRLESVIGHAEYKVTRDRGDHIQRETAAFFLPTQSPPSDSADNGSSLTLLTISRKLSEDVFMVDIRIEDEQEKVFFHPEVSRIIVRDDHSLGFVWNAINGQHEPLVWINRSGTIEPELLSSQIF